MFDWYPASEYYFARTQLVLLTLGMGMTLSLMDFVEIARRPRSFLVGLAGHLILCPLIAVLINAVTDFRPGIAVGLILVAAMPGGALSKFFAYFGRGNMALSISLTGVSTLLTLITVPLMLQLLASQYVQDFEMPVTDIMIDVALCLILPLVVGLTAARIWRKHHLLLSKICIRIGLVAVVVMVVGSLGSGRIRPLEHGPWVPIAIIVFCLLGQQLCMLPFRLMNWPRGDRLAIGIEVTMRNMNLALLISARLFPPGNPHGSDVFFVVLFYAGAAMVIGFPLALNHRRQSHGEAAPAPEKA
jgi:bile acid:Na+ symporter, BASS family